MNAHFHISNSFFGQVSSCLGGCLQIKRLLKSSEDKSGLFVNDRKLLQDDELSLEGWIFYLCNL